MGLEAIFVDTGETHTVPQVDEPPEFRIEHEGGKTLVVFEWREEGGRNKRFYRLSPDGRQMLKQLLAEWKGLNASLDRIV